jgi:hypothetical protein
MAIGLLESKTNPHPPGTVLLADNASGIENTEAVISQRLKHGTGKNAHIVLVPQPSYDPNDPLVRALFLDSLAENEPICPKLTITQNWSIWYRDSIVLAFVYCTFAFAGATGPLLSPIAFDLVIKYNKSFTAVSLLTGYQLLTVAFCGFLVSPATRTFGKRPVLIVCSLIGLAGSIWLIYADTYPSTLGARILQGIGVSFVSAPW